MNDKDKIAELQRQPESYGYVVFGSDRFKEMEPKSKGDEFRCRSQWLKSDGSKAFGFLVDIYRRPVDPGEGFELVEREDVYLESDEFTVDGIKWKPCGKPAGGKVSLVPTQAAIAIRRRKVCAVCGGEKQVASKHLDYGAAYGPVPEPCPACQPKTLGADGSLASSKGLEMLTEMAQGSMHVLATRSPAADKSPGQFGWKAGKDTSSNSGGSLEHRKVIAKGHLDLALYLIAQQRLVLVPHCAKFDFIEMTPEERKKWDDADKKQYPQQPQEDVCAVCGGTGFIPFTYLNAQPYGSQQCPICHAPAGAKLNNLVCCLCGNEIVAPYCKDCSGRSLNQQPPGEWIDVAKELPVFPGRYATIEKCQIEYNWFKPLNKWTGKVTHWWKWNDSLIPPPPVI